MKLIRWLREPELIGAPDCPLMHRWSIIDSKPATVQRTEGNSQGKSLTLIVLPKWLTRDRKLMVHRFLPNIEDRDPHDHPRGFWTFVVRGGYLDLVPCQHCEGKGEAVMPNGSRVPRCSLCDSTGVVVGDRMRPGTLRYRAPEHKHITRSGPKGAWTVVLMGPTARPWGFWRRGRFWLWKDYEKEFGFAMRCPTDEEREGATLKYTDEGVVPYQEEQGTFYKAAPVGISTSIQKEASSDEDHSIESASGERLEP